MARARLLRHHRLQVALLCAVTTASATAQALPDEAPFLSSRLPLSDGVALPGSRLPDPVDRAAQPQVHRIVVSVERDDIPADGQTPAKLSIRVLGADGQPVAGDTLLTVESDGGRWQIPGAASDEFGPAATDVDSTVPGIQVKAVDGRADVWLLAPIEPRPLQVRISAGGETATGTITFVPELRDMLAVGLVEGIIRIDSKSASEISPVRADDGFEREIRNWSRDSGDGKRHAALRTAFFLKGKISGRTLLTLAYDSDKPDRRHLFRDIDPERWYPVYGDASIVGFEARSTSRLYLRLDNGRNYLLYGDIVTGDGFSQRHGQGQVASLHQRSLGQYNRALTGVRGHAEGARGHINAFAAYDRLRQQVEEFPGRGVSGPYAVSPAAWAVIGSERVELVTRDRNQPAVILSVVQLQRFADYTFEPFSGRLLFKAPVPSVDTELNPVSVRVTYEVEQGGEKFWVGGVDGQLNLGSRVQVGGSIVRDDNPMDRYDLASVNALVKIGAATTLSGEYARSLARADKVGSFGWSGLLPGLGDPEQRSSGDAWRVELSHAGHALQWRGWYGETDRTFHNPAATMAGSLREAGAAARMPFGQHWEGYLEASHTQSRYGDAERTAAEAGVRWMPNDALAIEFGASSLKQDAGAYAASGSVLGAIDPVTGAGLFNTGSGWMSGAGNWGYDGLQGVDLDYVAAHFGVNWRPGNGRLELMAEAEQSLDGSDFRHLMAGVGYQLFDKSRLNLRYENYSGEADGSLLGDRDVDSDALVFGVESEYMKGGTLFSEYRMYDAMSGRQAQWANGLRNTWEVSDTLRLQTSAERLNAFGEAQSSSALGVGAEWRPNDLWQLSGRLEWRKTDDTSSRVVTRDPVTGVLNTTVTPIIGYRSWLSTLSAARKLNQDWTLLARNYYLSNDYGDGRGSSHEDRFQLGMAYRDTQTNRVNVLGMYQFWTQRLPDLQGLPGIYGLGTSTALVGDAAYGVGYGSVPGLDWRGFDKHIASVVADWHPSRPWWFTGKLAGKTQRDLFDFGADRFTAWYVGGRGTYDISERWDVSVLAATMWSPGGARQHALGAELGYLLTSNLWLSGGYNATGFRDDDLTGGDYTQRGAYLRLRFKFDETLFRRDNPDANRTLPR